jgi:hypothetical protein
MNAVEVAVRTAANLSNKDIGSDLMRKAFDPHTGVLTAKPSKKASATLGAIYSGQALLLELEGGAGDAGQLARPVGWGRIERAPEGVH